MKKASLLTSTAAGALIGASVFGSTPALAQMVVVDWVNNAVEVAMKTIQNTMSSTLTSITGQLSSTGPLATLLGPSTYGDVSTLLRQGFTQNANYSKAQVSGQMQISDAANNAMARFHRDTRNAQIRDEHTPNPLHCHALDNGQTITMGASQSWKVSAAIDNVKDARTQGAKGTPAYFGAGQAVQANNDLHFSRYCNADEAAGGLCGVSQNPNADQDAASLFGTGTYDGQDGINRANDYAITLIQPVVPAALRGDQLTTVAGQEALARRRAYNARMSLANAVVDYTLSAQTPSVTLNATQKQQMQNMGLTPVDNGSWLQAMTLDVNRRYSDVNYAAQLQAMPPAAVEREIALELAASNYLALQNYRVALYNANTNAAHLAATVENDFHPAPPVSTPTMSN